MEDFGIGGEDDLPDTAVVIRTGPMTDENMGRNAKLIQDETPGLWGICVASHPVMTEEQITWSMTVKGKTVTVTTAGLIRAGGFPVVADLTGSETSAMILLGGPPTHDTWDAIRACFPNPPKPNLAYGLSPIYGNGGPN